MKHVAAILFLSILTFNWVGFRLVSAIMEHHSDLALETDIQEAHYDESDLVEIRVPLNAPYLSNRSSGFERCDGEIRIGDTDYRYVMRKVDDGELVLRCLKNEEKDRIQNSRVAFFKLVNDLTDSSSGKEKQAASSFKSFTTVYKQETNSWDLKPLIKHLESGHFKAEESAQMNGYADIPKEPPRA